MLRKKNDVKIDINKTLSYSNNKIVGGVFLENNITGDTNGNILYSENNISLLYT